MFSRESRFFRGALAFVLALALLSHNGCIDYRWRAVPVTEVSLARERLASRYVRIATQTGAVGMRLERLDFPYVSGRAREADGGVVEVNLNQVDRVELVDLDARGRITESTPVSKAQVDQDPGMLLNENVRFRAGRDEVVLQSISQVRPPLVEGSLVRGDGPVRVDLRRAQLMEVREIDRAGTTVRVIAITSAVVAAVFIIALIAKESCPFVYIDTGNGWELVGEAYAGAGFRSIQRDDLLPLPDLGGAQDVGVRLRNEARETQYTDAARLVLVDHEPQVRALSTHNNGFVLAEPSAAPRYAVDARAGDLTTLVSARDGKLWETDPEQVARTPDEDLQDRLTAEFELAQGDRPVLEIVGGNTPWLDLVFGRFFAAMGDRLNQFLKEGNHAKSGPAIQRWREREGVDLIVEADIGDAWVRVATVPTVGPAALREIAIPLPSATISTDRLVRVRVRGGLGFWRIDRLALSTEANTRATVREVHPSAAASGGREYGDTLRSTDGRYNSLVQWGETLDMRFKLPPPPTQTVRSAFLFTNGYYNVHRPLQSRWEPGVLKRIRDEPGALARFGRDLAREYIRALKIAPQTASASREGHP